MTARANLAQSIVDQSIVHPDLRLGTVDDQIDLRTAVALASGCAQNLIERGLGPGDRVALVDNTSTNYVITWLACLLVGAPVALVNPTYPDDLVASMFESLAPKLVLGPSDVSRARRFGETGVDGLPGLDRGPFDLASFMHTSGTTGLPKFCAQTHDYFERMAKAMSAALDLTPDDRVLAPLPLFHINPMGYGMITALLTGADALTVGRFSASGFWTTVVEEGITVLVLHAPPVEILKRATSGDQAAGHRVRTMFYADRSFLDQFGIPAAVSGYGSTEVGGVSHLHRWQATDEIPSDAGRHGGPGRTDIEWRIDTDGMIFVRERKHAALFDGYVTAVGINPARDADGWFDTGDIGRADGEDYLVFLERRAESIRVKGEFVPIPFVESHVASIDGIRDYALWKRKSELVDDIVVLYVVADQVPVAAIKSAIAELPAYMRPLAIARVDTLPRDAAAGKLQRRLLSDTPVLEWLELA